MTRLRVLTDSSAFGFLLGILLAAFGGGVACAAFTANTENTGNSFSAAATFPPTVQRSVLDKGTGCSPGYVRSNASYYAYANVTKTPATVTANLSNFTTTGQTAAALTSGSHTVGGTTYNWRSALITASTGLTNGQKTYTVTPAGGSATTFNATVDGAKPTGTSIDASSGTGVARRPEAGETFTLTYDEPMDTCSILAGWDGSSTNVIVQAGNNSATDGNDRFAIIHPTTFAQLPLGTVSLGRTDYWTAGGITYGASGTPSTMAASGGAITITLGTPSAVTPQAAGTGTMRWYPNASATDRAGNTANTTTAVETGTDDNF